MVLTCHALAMRLVGASFSERADRPDSEHFQEVLKEAAALLRGEGLEPEEAEESRARLLAGFRWILVDEYQDVGDEEYALISALAGRTLSDADAKLTMFAVGDDDQNIYAFKGSSVRFIRSFEHDYSAKPEFLTDNYRSTRHIIEAANAVIEPAQDRMKVDNEIRIDRARAKDAPGGLWAERDPVGRGRVQILPAGRDAISQGQAAVAELRRLASLASDWDWSDCAVIAKEWAYLEPVRSICELEGIPVQMANEELPSVWHLRETQALLGWLRKRDSGLVRSIDLREWLSRQPPGPWIELLHEAVEEHEVETGEGEGPADSFVEWLAEWGREVRRRQRGLLLLTAHRAKGLEFHHVVVLDGRWDREDCWCRVRLAHVPPCGRARRPLGSRGSRRRPRRPTPPVLRRHDPRPPDSRPRAPCRIAPDPGRAAGQSSSPLARARHPPTAGAGVGPPLPPTQPEGRVSELRRPQASQRSCTSRHRRVVAG